MVLDSGRSPGEENGNPLQYSCLENPMDGGTLWATVQGVAKNWIQMKQFSKHACVDLLRRAVIKLLISRCTTLTSPLQNLLYRGVGIVLFVGLFWKIQKVEGCQILEDTLC